LINDIFLQEDAETILTIPLYEGMEDLVAWHPDPKDKRVPMLWPLNIVIPSINLMPPPQPVNKVTEENMGSNCAQYNQRCLCGDWPITTTLLEQV